MELPRISLVFTYIFILSICWFVLLMLFRYRKKHNDKWKKHKILIIFCYILFLVIFTSVIMYFYFYFWEPLMLVVGAFIGIGYNLIRNIDIRK